MVYRKQLYARVYYATGSALVVWEQIVRFAYKIQRQSPCRETDLMPLTLCLLGYKGGNTW